MKIIGVIPARLKSTRLANKALLEFNHKSLLQHTYEAVKKSTLFDSIYIATDSKIIHDTASNFDAQVIMTSKKNKNGTERCSNLIQKLDKDIHDNDLIINIQCDEPFLRKKHFKEIIELMNGKAEIATLISPIKKSEFNDPNTVKVSVNNAFRAIKFSRIYKQFETQEKLYKHIGVYAYKKRTLMNIAKLNEVQVEKEESLEQLRWLENNYIIHCARILENLISINTINDLKKVLTK